MGREKKRILVVDPGKMKIPELAQSLRDRGYEVVIDATIGVLGRLRSEKFDLIIIEPVIYPDSGRNLHFDRVDWRRTGIQLIQRIRGGELRRGGTRSDVPNIICSGVAEYTLRELAFDTLKVQAYIKKPFYLEAAIATILDYI